jgi:hypothetical protein
VVDVGEMPTSVEVLGFGASEALVLLPTLTAVLSALALVASGLTWSGGGDSTDQSLASPDPEELRLAQHTSPVASLPAHKPGRFRVLGARCLCMLAARSHSDLFAAGPFLG